MSKKSSASGNDSKFFQTTRKGETHELKLELNAPEKNKKKDAVKKVRRQAELSLPAVPAPLRSAYGLGFGARGPGIFNTYRVVVALGLCAVPSR